jgi:hypothetical protein
MPQAARPADGPPADTTPAGTRLADTTLANTALADGTSDAARTASRPGSRRTYRECICPGDVLTVKNE